MADRVDLIINGRSTKDYKDADWDAYRNHSARSRTTAPPVSATPAASGSIRARWTMRGRASARPCRPAGRA